MKFWEAMKAAQEGKKVKHKLWPKGVFIQINSFGELVNQNGEFENLGEVNSDWYLVEEPELYWQWINKHAGTIMSALMTESEAFNRFLDNLNDYQIFAGPWIKEHDDLGDPYFKKTDNWEQF